MSHESFSNESMEEKKRIDLSESAQRFYENDPELRLNKILSSLEDVSIETDADTWISRFSRRDNELNKIIVGEQEIPASFAKDLGLEGSTREEQFVYKLSHEASHAFQQENGYEAALVDVLNGSNEIDEKYNPYLELYAKISQIGRITSLSTLEVYKDQTESSPGILDYQILEDITEMSCFYMLSDESFLTMLDNSVTELNDDQKEFIAKKILEIIGI